MTHRTAGDNTNDEIVAELRVRGVRDDMLWTAADRIEHLMELAARLSAEIKNMEFHAREAKEAWARYSKAAEHLTWAVHRALEQEYLT